MITSASHSRWDGDIEISDPETAGLPAPSIIRSARIATIEAVGAERIGSLLVADRPAVHGQIASLLAAVLGLSG